MPKTFSVASVRAALLHALLIAYVIVQAAVPLRDLRTAGQVPFTWRMFVPDKTPPRFILHLKDGRELRLDNGPQRSKFVRRLRPEVDFAKYAPAHLCKTVPDLVSVAVVDSDRSDRYVCR